MPLTLSLLAIGLMGTGSPPASAYNLPIETRDEPWLLEADFDDDPALHATDGQTVILELEPGEIRGFGRGRWHRSDKPQRNSVRFLVEKERDFRFCIPADEPHIKQLSLRKRVGRKNKPRRPVLRTRRGGACEPVTVSPGSYVLDIYHNTSALGSETRVGFLRLQPETRPVDSQVAAEPTDPLDDSLDLLHMAIRYDGMFVSTNGDGVLRANATSVGPSEIWYPGAAGTQFTLANLDSPTVEVQREYDEDGGPCRNVLYMGRNDCIPASVSFGFADTKGADFFLNAWSIAVEGSFGRIGTSDPVNEGFQVYNTTSGGAEFNAAMRALACTDSSCKPDRLTLQSGEVALYDSCGFDGVAYVYADEVDDFSVYDEAASQGTAIGDAMARAIRVGPLTVVTLYTEAGFGGSSLRVTDDIACLDSAIESVSSLRVEKGRQYVVDSNGCASCDLPGVDLSELDLGGADFSNANLTKANLTDTSLFGATLDGATVAKATLDGADFLDTSLVCTDLSDNDLTTASFGIDNAPIAVVTDGSLPGVLGVEPETGKRTLLADRELIQPGGLDALAKGVVFVDGQSLLALQDGEITLVSSKDRGSGPRFLGIADVALAGDGSLVVTDVIRQALIRVDPSTGDREVLSRSGVGSGPAFEAPEGLTIATDGTIYVSDVSAIAIYAVDAATGNRTVLSDASNGSGIALQAPGGIGIDTDESVLMTDLNIPALLRIDPVSGDRTLVSGVGAGSGPLFSQPAGLAVMSDGTILVVDADAASPRVFGIDADTGERTIVSGDGVGSGPAFAGPVDVVLTDAASISGRIATDFSCRLDLQRSTLDLDTFPASLWRYADLTDAIINDAPGATLSTSASPLVLSGALLNGVKLNGSVLDSVNLGCAKDGAGANVCSSLQGTDMAGASLKGATLTSAQLQGASLSSANLDLADLSGAKLLGLTGGSPANLAGAFLRGVSLAGADLTGVIANNVNFYSITGATADASNATMTGAKFNNAYLAGADFSDAVLQSTEWNQAVLVGANFNGADLSKNVTADEITDFSGAYLQGTVFTNASVTDADFENSYWDLSPVDPTVLNIQMQTPNLGFTGYWNSADAPECVQATYPNDSFPTSTTPITTASNTCPDGGLGPCDGFWEDPSIPIEQATPQSAVDPDLPGACTTTDLCWLIVSPFCVP